MRRIAWDHRHETPIIEIETSPGAFDALHGLTLTVIPRITWEHDKDWSQTELGVKKGIGEFVDNIMAAEPSQPESQVYFIMIHLCHTGFHHLMPKVLNMNFAPDFVASAGEGGGSAKVMNTRVRLVGLVGVVGAAHLNSQEGVVVRQDPTRVDRLIVRLRPTRADHTDVSVKEVNCEQIDYE